MGTDNMNYKKLINYRLRDERALNFILSVMLVSILIGTIIKQIIDLKGIIVILLISIAFIGKYFYKKHCFHKVYQELNDEEMAKLDDDLNKTYFFLGGAYALSSKYIIDFKHSKIIKYSSILIIDKTTGLISHGRQDHACDLVYIVTKNEKISLIVKEYGIIKLPFTSQDYEGYYEGLYSYIKAQNPNVLEGYTRKNRKIIEEKYNIKV